jgi:hypothetical protein
VLVLFEEAFQALGCDVRFDARRVDAGTRKRKRTIRRIGRKDLHLDAVTAAHLLGDDHRQRIGLFAAGAGGHPGAQRLISGARGYQRRND